MQDEIQALRKENHDLWRNNKNFKHLNDVTDYKISETPNLVEIPTSNIIPSKKFYNIEPRSKKVLTMSRRSEMVSFEVKKWCRNILAKSKNNFGRKPTSSYSHRFQSKVCSDAL